MRIPAVFGRIVYIFGYPIFRILIKDTSRVYVAILQQDKILLNNDWLGMQKNWRLPGGGIKKGENPKSAAARELKEELGIFIDIDKLTTLTKSPISAKFGYKYYLYTINADTNVVFKPSKLTIVSTAMANNKDIKTYNLSEETESAIEHLGWV